LNTVLSDLLQKNLILLLEHQIFFKELLILIFVYAIDIDFGLGQWVLNFGYVFVFECFF
jgi:hypothetical protein